MSSMSLSRSGLKLLFLTSLQLWDPDLVETPPLFSILRDFTAEV